MADKKISVVIPVYDTDPKYLKDCFRSIDNQVYQNFEVILVNDCSRKYSTVKFANDYVKTHPKYRIFNLPNNSGPGNARNIGVKNATGEIIVYVDADDYILPIMLLKVNEYFCKWPDLDIISYENRVLLSNGIIKNVTNCSFNTDEPININTWNNAILDKPSVWAKAYSRKFLVDNNIWFKEKDVYMEDLNYLVMTYSKAKKLLFRPEVYYMLRETVNSRSLSDFNEEKVESLYQGMRSLYDKIKDDHSYISENWDKFFDLLFFHKVYDHKISEELKNSEGFKRTMQKARSFTEHLKDEKRRKIEAQL